MLVTPNEVHTMKADIEKAHGKVLTYGLGLGYFPFMTSRKEEVTSVTVVERSSDVIISTLTIHAPRNDCI